MSSIVDVICDFCDRECSTPCPTLKVAQNCSNFKGSRYLGKGPALTPEDAIAARRGIEDKRRRSQNIFEKRFGKSPD